ncbi:chromosome segregation protein SMC [Alkalihalophilus marmarensis]|jgi:chromosome segregation protein|uniref:Chromosome partition protein Smc n=1 Tax=Alkalihalophilus marmarensis DSM 21297 TaxID=1188261 RepID=U6SR78_9BACI|nr:chromosome segregation protein SMC [Alkalihalophilus marmarensis]ERN53166.1 chromosome partitioning protein Smc [Alkalihalophilus marmarensis DSM 21297]MCM3489612.1 chromosome segregation protein SMC [Alkalihalophilus marmarensis]
MFLKRLEVVGFKSFAEQMNIEFVPGVTAVVGPNGSGKSNISDAVRWVLGEQSAKSLRGSKMEDIIFAGSDTRKRLNYAEVSLILDNEDQHLSIDYSEVSVTRRVYRSGDSEYLINKQPCRLKDIIDLFLDSGLGREAYSIIGQGKVEEILSSKAEDRRVIFEEAAGVLKYKTRKVKAEKRLTETQDNLLRVEDILHELRAQVEPLEIQASIAKDYLEKKEELKEVEIALMVHEIEELHQEWNSEKEKLQSLHQEHDKRHQKLIEMEEELESLRERSKHLDQELSVTQANLLAVSEELEKNEGKREVLKERKKNASQNKEQLEKSIERICEQQAALLAELTEQEDKVISAQSIVKSLNEEITEQEKRLKLTEKDVNKELDRLKSDYIEVLNEQASIRNERHYLVEQKRQQAYKQSRLEDENQDLLKGREQLSSRLNEAKVEVEAKERELEQNIDQYRKSQTQLDQVRTRYQKRESKLYEAYQLIQKMQSRAEVLEEMQADFSGFFHGVKEILKAREGKLEGIVGAVAELTTVPKEYETALEIALGAASQHIVVESEKSARGAITFLKQHRLGRATFLPLPVMKERQLPDHLLHSLTQEPAFVGIASKLLQYEERYHQLFSQLLGQVIIARDLEGANKIARMLNHRYRVVTLEGDVVNPGGSMTGGSIKQKQTPLLGRKRELDELVAKLNKLKSSAAALETEVKESKREMQSLEADIESLKTNGEQARNAFQDAKTRLRELELESGSMEDRFKRYDREQSSFSTETEKMDERLRELDRHEEEMKASAARLEHQVSELEARQKEQQQSKETILQQLNQAKINYAAAQERYLSAKAQKEGTEARYNEVSKDASDLKDQLNLLQMEASDRTDGESSISNRIEANKKHKQEITIKLEQLKKERQEIDESYASLDSMIKMQQGEHRLIADECRQIEVRVNRLDVELDSRLNHLRNEYELSYEAARESYNLTVEPDQAKTKVKLIKLAIEELGSVNIGSIDEYERVRERHDFLTEQQSDLLEAKATLHDVIKEMDVEMTKRFQETYVMIQKEFKGVFCELFGGGEADLVLTSPDNLLETGVEIMVRPPGKKLQHLGLLSGGERALTAIALLFAILKVRPVPFCVLDEVEAALDEANVSRFAHYLKDFSGSTQFIVITHRKGTMEEADVLYGVTMQESGVSRLVSVRLEETKQLMET